VGAVDLTTLIEAQKTCRRQLLEQQQLKSELLKAYINLYQALGAGVVKGLGEDLKAIGTEPETFLYANLRKRETTNQDSNSASAQHAKNWEVNLYGIYERSVIPAMWRDLNRRYPDQMEKRALHLTLGDQVKGEKEEFTAWYRLAVNGFNSEKEAKALCEAMQAQQQSCSVTPPGAKLAQAKSQRAWWWP